MKTASLPILSPEPSLARSWSAVALQVNPFLHIGPDRVYNPLTDRTILEGEPGYAELRSFLAGAEIGTAAPAERTRLADSGWLVPPASEPER